MIRISGNQEIDESEPDYDDVDSLIVFTLKDSKGTQVIDTEQGCDRDDMYWTLNCLQYLCAETDEEIHIEEKQLRYIAGRLGRCETEKMELFLEYEYPNHFEVLQIIKNEEYIDKKEFVFRSFRQYRYMGNDFIVKFGSKILKNVGFSILYNRETKQFHSFNIDTFDSVIFSLYGFPNVNQNEAWIRRNNYQEVHEEFVSFVRPIVKMHSLFLRDLTADEF